MLDTLRLHISPLTPDTLPLILPPSIQQIATDIAFHELPTFPERNYGFVTLPIMEAQRLRKRVNGSILRGNKIKVEDARPKKGSDTASEDEEGVVPTEATREMRARKRKRVEGVIPAYELKDERKVKRGWTEPASAKVKEKIREKRGKKGKENTAQKDAKKRQEQSVYTDDAECLFKTEVPPNKETNASEKNSARMKKGKQKSTIVHEFKNTEKHPSFLRSTPSAQKEPTMQFDEEKGWVDGSGNVVEAKKTRSKRQAVEAPASTSSEETPAVDHTRLGSLTLHEQEGEAGEDETSSSGSSSTDSDDSSDSEAENSKSLAPTQKPSISVSPAPEISVEAASANTPTDTHPLEALYKKPALPPPGEKNKANLSVNPVPFAFFHSDDAPMTASTKQSVETATLISPPSSKPKRGAAARLPNLNIPPQTPYTQRDMSWRAQRSAAPTPDTALPGRGWPNLWGRGRGSRLSTDEIEEEENEGDEEVMASVEVPAAEAEKNDIETDEQGEENEDEADADDTPIKKKGSADQDKKQSTFAKEFYEKRGEFNRSWKQARRDAGKVQRAAANRSRKA